MVNGLASIVATSDAMRAGGGFVMFLYSGMLIWLNRRILPEPIKIKSARLIVVAITFAVFAVLSMYLVYWYVNAALTGQL